MVPVFSVCLEHTFGPDCSLTCEDCENGATCTAEGSGCQCPAGWSGVLCNQSEWQLCALPWLCSKAQPHLPLPPQLAQPEPLASTAARAAGARTVAPVTRPREPVLVLQAGQGWPASWVRNQTEKQLWGTQILVWNGLWRLEVTFRELGPCCVCRGVGAGRVGARTVSHPVPLPACAQGQHGLDCQQRCECQHGGLCDRRTGLCLCQPGWTGHKCQTREWGMWGLSGHPRLCQHLVLHREGLGAWAKR